MTTPSEMGLTEFSPDNSKKDLLYLISYYREQIASQSHETNPQGYSYRYLIYIIDLILKGA